MTVHKNKALTFRMAQKTYDKLRAEAGKKRRSLCSQICVILDDFFAKKDKK